MPKWPISFKNIQPSEQDAKYFPFGLKSRPRTKPLCDFSVQASHGCVKVARLSRFFTTGFSFFLRAWLSWVPSAEPTSSFPVYKYTKIITHTQCTCLAKWILRNYTSAFRKDLTEFPSLAFSGNLLQECSQARLPI